MRTSVSLLTVMFMFTPLSSPHRVKRQEGKMDQLRRLTKDRGPVFKERSGGSTPIRPISWKGQDTCWMTGFSLLVSAITSVVSKCHIPRRKPDTVSVGFGWRQPSSQSERMWGVEIREAWMKTTFYNLSGCERPGLLKSAVKKAFKNRALWCWGA